VGQLKDASNKAHNAELKLFLEVYLPNPTQGPAVPLEKTKEDILLFFKLYNPEKEELRYVGRSFVKGGGRPTDILEKLNEMAGFAPTEEIQLYEVSSCLDCELCELFQL
jgi:ubiquitin carboxyl-terminal hydrolase 7